MPPRTIDNLGIDVSTRYAEDQKNLDEKIIKEARGIAPQTQIDVTVPSFTSEFEMLLETNKRNSPWAEFQAPNKYNEQKKRLFTHQMIPSLGSADKKESQTQKILSKVDATIQRKILERGDLQNIDPKKKFAFEQEDKELEKQKKVLIKLLDCIVFLDKNINLINGRRSQYQKG